MLGSSLESGAESKKRSESLLETDPTTYSPLPISERTIVGKVDGYFYPIVESDGVFYVEFDAEKKNVSGGQLTALLFKGIVNVSDVVEGVGKYAGKYYSKIMPLEKIREQLGDDEVQADIALMEAISGDEDRFVIKEAAGYYNQNVNYDGKHAAYFDFTGRHQYRGLFDMDDSAADFAYGKCSPRTLTVLLKKARELKARVGGEEGLSFLQAIAEKIDLQKYLGDLKDAPRISYALKTVAAAEPGDYDTYVKARDAIRNAPLIRTTQEFAAELQAILLGKIDTLITRASKELSRKVEA